MSHDRLSPSGADKWSVCAAAPSRSDGIPDTGDKTAADWGTDSHAYLEKALIYRLDPMLLAPQDNEDEQEKAKVAKVAYDYALGVEDAQEGPCVVRPESRVNPGHWLSRDDMKGTADILIASSSMLELVDQKAGRHGKFPECPQLLLYMLGALAEYWPEMEGECPFTVFKTTIVQPRRMDGLPAILSHEYTLDDLIEAIAYFDAAAKATDAENPAATPGEDQCQWCLAKPNCAEYSQWCASALPGTSETAMEQALLTQAPAALEPDALADLLRMRPSIQLWLKTLEEEARARLAQGKFVPGFKLARSQGRPKWIHDTKDTMARFKRLRLKKAQWVNESIRTPLQVMKAVGVTPKQSEALAAMWERPEGPLKLVAWKVGDPAIPETMFKPVIEDQL